MATALALAALLAAAVLYGLRARTLARRGRPVHPVRGLAFGGGLAVVALALASPLDRLGEERLLAAHMLQHLLLGDLAALLIVAGLTGPLLRPVLALPAAGALRALANPLVALPLWAANLVAWHVPAAYQAALANPVVHALEHALFLGAGVLVWAALLEPLPGPRWFGTGWKVAYVASVRLVALALGNVLLAAGTVVYPRYADAPRTWGLSPLEDQQLAGALLLAEGGAVTLALLAVLVLRLLREDGERRRLVEDGLSERAAARAVRYRRAPGWP